MKKLGMSMVTILLAVVMLFTGMMPMESAKAAADPLPVTTVPGLTIDYIIDNLGDTLNYGLVAREYHQDNHAETSVCVDLLKKTSELPFLNTSKTYSTGKPYTLYAAVSAPNGQSLDGMQFALCTRSGSNYTILEDKIVTVETTSNVTTVGWNIPTGSALLNETLYVRQVEWRNGAYRIVNEGTNNTQHLTVTYGPKVVSSSPNSSYVGEMVCNFDNESIKFFDPKAPKPSITFGKNMDIGYYDKVYKGFSDDEKTPREYETVWVSLRNMNHVPKDDQWIPPSWMGPGFWWDVDTYQPVKVEIRYDNQTGDGAQQLDQNFEDRIYYQYDYEQRKGVFYWSVKDSTEPETYLDFTFTQETDRANQLLLSVEDFSTELGNIAGGTTQYYDKSQNPAKLLDDDAFKNTSPSIYGNSTVTGPVDANGNVVSVYNIDAYNWEMSDVTLRESIGYQNILIAPNEYVVFNIICPAKGSKTESPTRLTMLPNALDMYIYEAGKAEQATWPQNDGDPVRDTGSSDRVIFNFVYWDEEANEYLPYEGIVDVNSQHGGTLLAPKARIEATRNPPNGAIIADSVYNAPGIEIHQRTLTNPSQGTWVHMVGREVEETGYIKIEKLNSEKAPVEGAVFGVYSNKACSADKLVASKATDSNGVALFDGLVPGTYYVKEISVPEGSDYVLDTNVYTVEVTAGVTTTVGREGYLINLKNKGYLKLTKVDEADTSKALPGAVFKLYKQDGDTFNESTARLIKTFTTDAAGKINAQLEIGTYWLKEEKAPFGYAVSTPNVWQIEIEAEQTTVVETAENSGVVTNVKLPSGTLKVTKVAAENYDTKLENAEFTIYEDKACTEEVASFKTNYFGEASIEIPVGDYWVKETVTPAGREPDTKEYPVKITEGKTTFLDNNDEDNEDYFTNEKQKKTIYLVKVGGDYSNVAPLKGVKFGIYSNQGCNEADLVTTAWTDSEGIARFSLFPGHYWLKEILAAPGYNILNDVKEIWVNESDENNKLIQGNYFNDGYNGAFLNMKNDAQTGRVRLYKENEEGVRLDGVQFGLYTDPNCAEESLYRTAFTEYKQGSKEHGKLEIPNVPYGTYYLKEIAPLEGYQENNKIYTVVVNGSPSDVQGDAPNKDNGVVNVVVNKKITTSTTTSITVTKVWPDGEPEGEAADVSASLRLYKGNDEVTKDASGADLSVSRNGNQYTWNNLPAEEEDGTAIVYYVTETKLDGYAVPAYSNTDTTVKDKALDGGSIFNAKAVSATVMATKSLNGNEPVEGQFGFTLTDKKTPATVLTEQNNEKGEVIFTVGPFEAEGTYEYTLEEVIPKEAVNSKLNGVTYDTTKYNVIVNVARDPETNKLVATVDYDPATEGVQEEAPEFTNTYTTEGIGLTLDVSKKLANWDYVPAGETHTFTFTLSAAENCPDTGYSIEDGTETITFTKTSDGVNMPPVAEAFALKFTAANTYVFTVRETNSCCDAIDGDETEYTVTVEVGDDDNGKLQVTSTTITKGDASVQNMLFVNAYKVTGITVTKVWNDNNKVNKRPDSITINVMNGETLVVSQTLTATEVDGVKTWPTSCTFENLPAYAIDADGKATLIDYTVEEATTDENQNALPWLEFYSGEVSETADNTFTITNTLKTAVITISGTKVWEDAGFEDKRPDSITVSLLANGQPATYADGTAVPAVTVTADNNWAFSFENLPEKDDQDNPITYTVTDSVNGYIMTQPGNAENNYTIKNKYNYIAVNLGAQKKFDGKDPQNVEPFTFELLDADKKKIDEAKNDQYGTVAFAEMTYTKPGTYTYYIKEVPGNNDDIYYDDTVFTVTVVIGENDETKELTKSVTYNNGTEDVYTPTFRNGTLDRLSVPVNKVVTGTDNVDTDFEFHLEPVESSKPWQVIPEEDKDLTISAKALNDGNGSATAYFPEIEVKTAEHQVAAHGGLRYMIVEKAIDRSTGYIYDSRVMFVLAGFGSEGGVEVDPNYAYCSKEEFDIAAKYVDDNRGKVTEKDYIEFPEKDFEKLRLFYIYQLLESDLTHVYYEDGDPLGPTFVNSCAKVEEELTLTKKMNLEGVSALPAGQELSFAFEVKPVEVADENGYKVEQPQPVTFGTDTADKSTTAKFEFTKAGTYVFEVAEKAGDAAGVVYAQDKYTVTYVVNADIDDVAVTIDADAVVFKNTYAPAAAALTLDVSKQLLNWAYAPAGDEYTFTFALNAVENQCPATGWAFAENTDGVAEITFTQGTTSSALQTLEDAFALKFTAEGTYVFAVRETSSCDAIEGDQSEYTVTVTVANNNGQLTATPVITKGESKDPVSMTFVNTLKTISITVTKEWVDEENQDGERPESITINVMNGTKKVASKTLKAEDVNGVKTWPTSWTFENLPKYDAEGEEITYTVTEEPVEDYFTQIDQTTYKITNTKIADTDAFFSLLKTVEVLGNIRPADTTFYFEISGGLQTDTTGAAYCTSVEVEAGSDRGEITETLRFDKAGTYVYEICELVPSEENGLPEKFGFCYTDKKYKVKYDVELKDVQLKVTKETWYATDENGDYQQLAAKPDYLEFVNEFALANISVNKTWSDSDAAHDGIQVQLYKKVGDAAEVAHGEPVTLSDKVNWQHVWPTMPLRDGDHVITYRVAEVNVPDGYVKNEVQSANGFNTSITNTKIEGTTGELTISKTVEVLGDVAADAADVFTFSVTQTKAPDGVAKAEIDNVTLKAGDETTVNLVFPAAGEYVYEVREAVAEADKKPGYTYDDAVYTVTYNVTQDGAALVAGTPVWTKTKGNETDTSVSSAAFVNKYDEVTVKLEAGKTLEGATLADEQFSFQLSGAGIETQIKQNDAEGKIKFDAISYKTDGEYTYTITEVAGSDLGYVYDATEYEVLVKVTTVNGEKTVTVDYDTATEGVQSTVPVFQNKYGLTQIAVTKVWDDSNNQDGKRPDSITIKVMNGEKLVASETLTATEVDGVKTWPVECKFENLPKYDAEGKEIAYTVTEDKVTDYQDPAITGSVAEGFEIKNSYKTSETSIKVTKVWEDGNAANRPAITLTLYKDNDVVVAVAPTVNGNEYTWNGLPKMENGQEITYYVKETAVPGYKDPVYTNTDAAVTDKALNNGTITNTLKTTSITVEKVWSDSDAAHAPIQVQLYKQVGAAAEEAQGNPVQLPDNGSWTYTWSDLPEYGVDASGNAEKITYRVDEVNVPSGYVKNAGALTDGKVTITNTKIEGTAGELTISKTVEKIGDVDANNSDVFAFSVTQTKAPNGVDKATFNNVNLKNGDTPAKVNLVFPAAGEYEYEVREVIPAEEDKLPGYTYDDAVYTVTYNVTQDDTTAKLTAGAPVWTKNGADTNATTAAFVNKYDEVTVELEAGKTLNGATLADQQFSFQLSGTGIETQIKQNNAAGKIKFDAISYKTDGEYTYTITEVAGSDLGYVYDAKVYEVLVKVTTLNGEKTVTVDYDTATEGVQSTAPVFQNKYGLTQIAVTKVWDDANNQDGVRPDSITINVMNGTTKVASKTLTAEDVNNVKTWPTSWTFENLPKYDVQGKEITYTVTEEKVTVEGYQQPVITGDMANGFEIKNSYKPGMTSITVTKRWEDDSNKLGKRPTSLTINLLADGTVIETKELTATNADASNANAWTWTFTNLPMNKVGGVGTAVVYTVEEVTKDGSNDLSWVKDYTIGAVAGDAADGFEFTNTCKYEAGGVLSLEATKMMSSDSDVQTMKDDQFTFGIYKGAGENAVLLSTSTNDEDGAIVFDEISYDQDDIGATYLYTVKELSGIAEDETYNYTYDDTVYNLSVSVTDGGNGNLIVTKTITKGTEAVDAIEFTNTIKNKVGHIGVMKVDKADPEKGLPGAVFGVYTQVDADGKIVKTSWVGDIRTGDTGAGSLQDLPIGTYYVQESMAPRGYQLDETVYTVVVEEGKTAMVNGEKVLNAKLGRLMLRKADRLNPDKALPGAVYTLYNAEACLPETKVADITTGDDGIGYLDDVAPGTYWVKETKAPVGYEVDPLPYKVVVEENPDPEKPAFVQVTDFPLRGALVISKTVVGVEDTTETFLFDIELSIATADPIVGSYEATLNGVATEKVTFAATEKGAKATVSLKSGDTLAISGVREGVTYTVTEQSTGRYDVTVNNVKTNVATGTIKEAVATVAAFQNTLKQTGFTVEKVWQGAEGGEIELTLFANGVKVEPQPKYTKEGNKYSYADLTMVDEKGQEILYTVKETAMAGYTTSYKNIAPYADKTDCAYNGGQIINQALTSFSVKKEWAGLAEGETAPAIQLTLYCNGTIVTKATPKPDAKGWYVYTDLPATVEGKAAVYTVKEEPLSGYTTTYINKGENAAVTDCAYNGSTIVNSKIPQTGDGTPLALWMTTMLLAALGLVGLKAYSRKREN